MRRLLLLATLALLLLPGTALAAGTIPEIHDEPFADVDTRSSVAPTAAQRAAVTELGATATWSRFGTPKTLVKHGGFLATGVTGARPVDAARAWLDANRALFGLGSLDSLRLEKSSRLTGSSAYAVLFRQHFGNLVSTRDGYVTVGVAGAPGAWKIGFVSGALAPGGAPPAAQLSAQAAWLAAAGDLGRTLSVALLGPAADEGGWKVFTAQGLVQDQRARLRALPTPDGVRPVWETLFVDVAGGSTHGYSSLVDAVTGEVLVRDNLVHQAAPAAATFEGSVPTNADAACDTDRGPWTVGADETVHSVDVGVAALPANDAVIQLERDGNVVASGDLLTNPEVIHYAPTGGVPAGDYTVVVCDFADGAAWLDPATYTGSIAFNSFVSAGAPYPPKWATFPAYPQPPAVAGFPWNVPSADTRETWCWDASINGIPVVGCDAEVGTLASRVPWDVDPRTQQPTFSTLGNNALTSEAWVNPPTVEYGNITPGGTNYRPVSPARTYSSPWANSWYASNCDPASLVPTVGADIGAAVTNLFVTHNRMHDWAYHLGLTEENWNAQLTNFGNGGTEGDPVVGDVQSGALTGAAPAYGGRDNANMLTLPDGVPPITNMYLWQPLRGAFYAPCVDGDYDMAIIGHEYGHMIENRMIGKGGNRSGHHAGAMGESHGDLMAMEYLNENGYVPVADENRYAVGAYATGQKQRGIRNFAMNDSPLNFSDLGYDITGPQVHADGEIWSATQFDVRRGLVAKHGEGDPATQKACADGQRPASECPGNRRWMQLVFDAYLLMPVDASMLEARDALLAADVLRFGGENQAEIWLAFARRGMGAEASSSNTNANTLSDPTPDFGSPLAQNATVTFAPVGADGEAVPASLYVGRFEGRVSPVADTVAATEGSANLDATASFAPGTYDLVVAAPGYGHTRLTRTFAAGESVTLAVELAPNLASAAGGATVTGDGVRLDALIDDTEATNWQADGAPVAGKQVTVDLAGGAHQIDRVRVSALLAPGQNRFTALRQFEIWTCLQSAERSCSDASAYTKQLTSPADSFPGSAPRPVAPELLLREFALPAPVEATHVRFVVVANQCTGQPLFQGVQDSDPTNPTDCRTGAETDVDAPLLPPRDSTVVAAELQVVAAPVVEPTEPNLQVASASATRVSGREHRLTATVTNAGAGDAGASATTFVTGGTTACTADTPALAAGASATVTCSWDTRGVKKGVHTVEVTADAGGAVAESDETDNGRTIVVVL